MPLSKTLQERRPKPYSMQQTMVNFDLFFHKLNYLIPTRNMINHKTNKYFLHTYKPTEHLQQNYVKNHALTKLLFWCIIYTDVHSMVLLLQYSSIWNVKLHFLYTHALYMHRSHALLRSDAIIKDIKKKSAKSGLAHRQW